MFFENEIETGNHHIILGKVVACDIDVDKYLEENDYKITLKCNQLLAELYRKQYEGVVVRGYNCPSV